MFNLDMELLDRIYNACKNDFINGKVAAYIPALKKAKPSDSGICIFDVSGNVYYAGNYNKKFSIQSISKIITLTLAIMDNGDDFVFSKVGAEPTGDAFNSMLKLEITQPKPYNPMINAGAIAVSSMIKGKNTEDRFMRLLDFAGILCGNKSLEINSEIYLSEKETGNRNRALAYYMKDAGIIDIKVEDALDLYFKQCSIMVDCVDIAKIAAIYANDGLSIETGERIVPSKIVSLVKTLMFTCGMYDESGKFAIEVGIPAKSGVGGGILAIAPNKMGIGTFGPSLNTKGNSLVGMCMLKKLSNELNLSIF